MSFSVKYPLEIQAWSVSFYKYVKEEIEGETTELPEDMLKEEDEYESQSISDEDEITDLDRADGFNTLPLVEQFSYGALYTKIQEDSEEKALEEEGDDLFIELSHKIKLRYSRYINKDIFTGLGG